MFASKVIISEETRAKNQLSKRQQGKLRYQKLVEYEKSGELSYASTRNELAQMLGFPENNKTGISWVNNMVNRGYISETLHGYENGKMRKEFHLTNKVPDYDFERIKQNNKEYKALKKAQEIVVAEEVEKRKAENNLVITKGDLTITTTLASNDIVHIIMGIIQ